jgi:hypothetical protein
VTASTGETFGQSTKTPRKPTTHSLSQCRANAVTLSLVLCKVHAKAMAAIGKDLMLVPPQSHAAQGIGTVLQHSTANEEDLRQRMELLRRIGVVEGTEPQQHQQVTDIPLPPTRCWHVDQATTVAKARQALESTLKAACGREHEHLPGTGLMHQTLETWAQAWEKFFPDKPFAPCILVLDLDGKVGLVRIRIDEILTSRVEMVTTMN